MQQLRHLICSAPVFWDRFRALGHKYVCHLVSSFLCDMDHFVALYVSISHDLCAAIIIIRGDCLKEIVFEPELNLREADSSSCATDCKHEGILFLVLHSCPCVRFHRVSARLTKMIFGTEMNMLWCWLCKVSMLHALVSCWMLCLIDSQIVETK